MPHNHIRFVTKGSPRSKPPITEVVVFRCIPKASALVEATDVSDGRGVDAHIAGVQDAGQDSASEIFGFG
jgi:hypothetical protein